MSAHWNFTSKEFERLNILTRQIFIRHMKMKTWLVKMLHCLVNKLFGAAISVCGHLFSLFIHCYFVILHLSPILVLDVHCWSNFSRPPHEFWRQQESEQTDMIPAYFVVELHTLSCLIPHLTTYRNNLIKMCNATLALQDVLNPSHTQKKKNFLERTCYCWIC